ncbi:hypothetical protein ACFOD4_00410 [Pseudoroseomonas globiformis]|uniref:Uncharacterized protein n=1 Tax=Teichococcus globiformis TaxID=2307229 RepID=A0ABV7FXM1_9PROT
MDPDFWRQALGGRVRAGVAGRDLPDGIRRIWRQPGVLPERSRIDTAWIAIPLASGAAAVHDHALPQDCRSVTEGSSALPHAAADP